MLFCAHNLNMVDGMQGYEMLLRELFVIFLATKIAGEIFERMKVPSVLGEILVGVLLGPYALHWIEPSETIRSISEIGAIFLLFVAGLEMSSTDLVGVGGKALKVAVTGVVLPFVLGFSAMYWFGNDLRESIFVGAAMVATSVGITARVLGDMDVLASRAAQIILGAAVFDDILGMLLLAVVTGLATTGTVHWIGLALLAVESVLFALFMVLVGPRIIEWLRPTFDRFAIHNAPLAISLLLCLLLSWLATRIGMTAIVGAFFAGIVFAPERKLREQVIAISEFFTPFFFFAIGAQFDVGIFGGKVLMIALVISVLAVVSKLIGCAIPLLGEDRRTVLSVGIGMVPRGEVALIVALVGLDSNIIKSSTYAVVVFMTAFTTVLAPLLMRYTFATSAPLEPQRHL